MPRKLTKLEVVEKLKELNLEFDENANYNDLLALLKENTKETTAETAPVKQEETGKEEEPKVERNPFLSFDSKTPMTGKAHAMKKKLQNQPRVPVFIPLGHEELVGSTHQVTLNGYTMFIRKGQQVMVPVQVAEVLEQKFKHQDFVRQHPLRVSGANDIKLMPFN